VVYEVDMQKTLIVLLLTVLCVFPIGSARGEFLSEFDPEEQPLYWVSGTYLAEAVKFDVGEEYVSLDEVWLHYDVWDRIELYIIKTLPDTTEHSLIHRHGEVILPAEYEDSWMPVDLRDAEIQVSGEFWIFIKNDALTQPPGISFRGENISSNSYFNSVGVGWSVSAGNFGVGIVINEPTGIELDEPTLALPKAALKQNYPNPFNPTTVISFDISGTTGVRQHVSLVVYDARGRRIRTLVDSELEPGTHEVVWDGRNDRGEPASSGLYFSTLRNCGKTYTRKMFLRK
jgi:hypothetical protein